MRNICLGLLALFLCIGDVNAAVRTQQQTSQRSTAVKTSNARQNAKSIKVNNTPIRATSSRTTKQKSAKKVSTSRATSTQKTVMSRVQNGGNKTLSARSAASQTNKRLSRAAATTKTVALGNEYVGCRDAYFSCMDQFCAMQNETYRRCVCSSKLKDIQAKEQKIAQTTDSLKDFQNINIDAISKTAGEVKAMGSASAGEAAMKKDTSASAKTLNNISEVLNDTKQAKQSSGPNNADFNAAWNASDLIGGTDIANLTGEALYNAVHKQCSEIVTESCSETDLKMVSSAYGIYIENDCAALDNSLASKKTSANAAIRSTRHQMQDARLENYNAHNSLSLNDCIAKVREDLTQETACGKNYIHCLDITGKYLNSTTGEPIYSSDFYQLENQIIISGDVLSHGKNNGLVSVLNNKRSFAKNSLDLCKDNADDVWNEFMRQAIVEIYQGQQKRVRDVKSECLKVVNDCYLKQSDQIKTFSDNSSDISLGQILELSEEMCKTKLTTCSNLYGGGSEGLAVLVNTMKGITDSTIAQTCPELLDTFVQKACAVSSNDSVHSFPYGCRAYSPGEQQYAKNAICNTTVVNPFDRSNVLVTKTTTMKDSVYICSNSEIRYIKCNFNYYLYNADSEEQYGYSKKNALSCEPCPTGLLCTGGTAKPASGSNTDLYKSCGEYYIGSLYHQMVRYALQNCTRPSNNTGVLSESLLGDVDKAMKKVQQQLVAALSVECENQNGKWVDTPWIDEDSDGYHDTTGDSLLEKFYTSTGTNKLWGYCK